MDNSIITLLDKNTKDIKQYKTKRTGFIRFKNVNKLHLNNILPMDDTFMLFVKCNDKIDLLDDSYIRYWYNSTLAVSIQDYIQKKVYYKIRLINQVRSCMKNILHDGNLDNISSFDIKYGNLIYNYYSNFVHGIDNYCTDLDIIYNNLKDIFDQTSNFEFLETDIAKDKINKIDNFELKKEILFFLDKCIKCKDDLEEMYLDLNISQNTYNVNLGARIYSFVKIDQNSEMTIFEVLRSICVIDEDLQSFMKSYKVLQITGIIIHPLTQVKEVSPVDNYVIVTNTTNIDLGIDQKIQRNRNILGLKNLGNTCFLNSSLQALLNCKEFSDYFYSCDIKSDKQLCTAFSDLIKLFDDDNCSVVSPYKFKLVLGSKRQMYYDVREKDAMEFIEDLLNEIHEELKSKKMINTDLFDGYEKWQIENQSIVTNLFFTKMKTSIVCSECHNARSFFEPIGYFPLSVPEKKHYVNNIVIFYDSLQRVPLKIFADENITILELKKILHTEYNVTNQILCCNIVNNKIVYIEDTKKLRNIKNTLFCYEYMEKHKHEYFWIKVNKQYYFWTSYLDFWILGRLNTEDLLDNGYISKNCIHNTIRMRLTPFIDQKRSSLLFESLDNFIQIEYEHGPNMFYKKQVICNMTSSNFDKLFGFNFKPIDDMINLQSEKVDLKSCINLFLEKDYVFGDTKQFCNSCNNYTIQYKDTQLERLPKYLIIQLKRYKFTGVDFEKVDTFIDFDLGTIRINNNNYKIISIINHITPSVRYAFRSVGSNGHYTAYVKYKEEWYLCDDQLVTKVSNVSKEDAYIFILEKLD